MKEAVGYGLIIAFAVISFYAYFGYPLLLVLISRSRNQAVSKSMKDWPRISITVPAYNEEREIGATIRSLLDLDYPRDRRQIIVVSDASSDRTDEIVRSFESEGVQLHRMDKRSGKTAAENAVGPLLTGEIVVNTDASIRIDKHALKPMISAFSDPTVGLASGRDVSISRAGASANTGESKYVGYEMYIRSLETRAAGIIGASGCFYSIRTDLHRTQLQEGLSRDFAAALISRQHGYRAVSVDEAICYVPRTASVTKEYKRKVRTMTRGMETLWAMRSLLNPFRYGLFSWMLFSHKICRWAAPWGLLAALVGIALLATGSNVAALLLGTALLGIVMGVIGLAWPENSPMPKLLSVPTYLLVGNLAAVHASLRALHGDRNAVWEPTRRDAPSALTV